MNIVSRSVLAAIAGFALLPMQASAQTEAPDAAVSTDSAPQEAENDGTDPTKPVGSAKISFEHIDLDQGVSTQTIAGEYTMPVAPATTLRFKAPIAAVSGIGNGSLGLGDIGVKLTKVVTRTNTYGVVVGAEIVADTASRPELGSGKWVFKPNFIYARFLKGGHIFAPALVQSISFAGDSSRRNINQSTLDFYLVPRLANKKLFMTIDPAVTYDWKSEEESAALAVTFGYNAGKMAGANSQVSLKPSVGIGGNRAFNWGMQLNFQLLGL